LAGDERIAGFENVAVTYVVAIEVNFLSESVDESFDGEGGLIDAEAAHGAAGWIVGEDGDGFQVEVGNAVWAGAMAGGSFEDFGSDGGVGPGVADHFDLDGLQVSVFIAADFVGHFDWVTFWVEAETLLAIECEFDGSAGEVGHERGLSLYGEVFLSPERSTVAAEFDEDTLLIDAKD